jgi:catecholate siderophore receptor
MDHSTTRRAALRRRAGLGATTACVASAMGFSATAAAYDQTTTEVGSVVVTARKPTIGVLSEKIQNTAQSINVVPKEVLQQEGVTSLQEALKNVPGVTLNAGEGGAHGDTVNLRGFPANDDFLDGLRDTGFYTRDAFDLDALEVYKGPASTLFGRGSTGGVINQVSKQAHLGEAISGALTVGGKNENRETVDADYGLGDYAAFRINAMNQSSGVEQQPYVLNRRWAVAPSVVLGIGTPTKLTVDYLHQVENNIPDPGIPYIGNAPAPVGREVYYGLPAIDRNTADVDIATIKLEHKITDDLSVTETVRYGNYGFTSLITEPHFAATPVVSSTSPLSSILVQRDRPGTGGVVRTAMSDTELNYKVDTGPLSHNLVVGLDLDQEGAHTVRYANQLSSIALTPLLDPNPFEVTSLTNTVSTRAAVDTQTVSGLIGDSIDIGDQWNFVAAVRVDRFHARSVSTSTTTLVTTTAERTDTIATPRASLVYKPLPNASVYVSYGTSYDPSAENLSLSTTTAQLAPEKDQTFEVGAKATVLQNRLSLTGAVFNTEMTNARVTDPVSKITSLQGNLRARGMELGASGHLTDKWEVLAGYTYLDARTVSSLTKTSVGELLPNTAHNQANLWTIYEFTEAFHVGVGVNYLGERAADSNGIAFIPGYTTFDGMISYQINSHIGVQLNGYNLADKYYFTNAYYSATTENHVIPGAGRTITLTLTGKY